METEFVMFVVSTPKDHADALREAMASAGAGQLGNYAHCSFTYEGEGRFIPSDAANPSYGAKRQINMVPEVRIEMLCKRTIVSEVIAAMKKAHPYEEPAYHYTAVEV